MYKYSVSVVVRHFFKLYLLWTEIQANAYFMSMNQKSVHLHTDVKQIYSMHVQPCFSVYFFNFASGCMATGLPTKRNTCTSEKLSP